jgi:hypothetical protein
VPQFAQPRPCPRQRPSARGRATTNPPPPLACNISSRSTATNREGVRPIAALCHLFACVGPTSPAVSLPPPPRVPLWGFVDSRA